jgi:hypothetical protein
MSRMFIVILGVCAAIASFGQPRADGVSRPSVEITSSIPH